MGMNHRELVLVASSLQRCFGASVHNVWQPTRDRVVVGLSDGTLLLLVPRGPYARMHSIRRRPKNPDRPYSFQGACRSHLRGPLTDLRVAPDERLVTFTFAEGELVLRLTGRSGGLWLVRDGRVVAAFDGPAPEELPPLPALPLRDAAARFTPSAEQTWDEAAARWFDAAEAEARRADLRRQVERDLRRAIERRLITHLEGDLDKASEAPALRARAELLAANLHHVGRGARSAELLDWSTGETVVLTLDPRVTPSMQMDAWFQKARRLERSGDQVLERLDAAERRLGALVAELDVLASTSDERLAELRRAAPARGPARDRHVHPDITGWRAPTGARVWVGRNAKGNRRLTFQVARGHDWWLHVRDQPGGHVLIPCERDQSPDLELLLGAAQLALVASKVAAGGSADVQYTRARDVRSIPGELARVRIANERVLHVRRDPDALRGWSLDGEEADPYAHGAGVTHTSHASAAATANPRDPDDGRSDSSRARSGS